MSNVKKAKTVKQTAPVAVVEEVLSPLQLKMMEAPAKIVSTSSGGGKATFTFTVWVKGDPTQVVVGQQKGVIPWLASQGFIAPQGAVPTALETPLMGFASRGGKDSANIEFVSQFPLHGTSGRLTNAPFSDLQRAWHALHKEG